MTITLRLVKGTELTHAELDGNFTDLDERLKTVEAGATDFLTAASLKTLNGESLVGAGDVRLRELLTAPRTYYVATTGSDTNDGLTAATPFLTIQKALDTVPSLDFNGYDVTIQLADGTYNKSLIVPYFTGGGRLVLKGNATTPTATVVSSTQSGPTLLADRVRNFVVENLTLTNSGSAGSLLLAADGSHVIIGTGVVFGPANAQHITSTTGSTVMSYSNYTVSGSAGMHVDALWGGYIRLLGGITISGTPNFTTAFARAYVDSMMTISGTITGSATGKKYDAQFNGVISVGGAGVNYLPGNVAGTTSTGGQYG